MDKEQEKKLNELKDLVLAKEKEGKVVIWAIDELVSCSLDKFVSQPTDGLLYDLNRLPEVVLTFIHEPKWINDYAVYMVIKRLKEMLAEKDAMIAALRKHIRILYTAGNDFRHGEDCDNGKCVCGLDEAIEFARELAAGDGA